MSNNGYFDEIDDSSDLNPLETEQFSDLRSGGGGGGNGIDQENYDAFNEETFDCALEGDWEAEHDKLLMLEGGDINGNGSSGGGGRLNDTLTKYDNGDDEDLDNYDNDDDYLNGYNQTNSSKIRLDSSSIKQMNIKSNLISNNNNNNNNNNHHHHHHSVNNNSVKSVQDNRNYISEDQLKLLNQQFQKNQQLMLQQQQAQKQYQQQQQLNSAMLAAAIASRNNQQNLIQKQQQQFNLINNEQNRKTPIGFNNNNSNNNNMSSISANDKENDMYSSYSNQNSFKNNINNNNINESDSIKLKNLLDKINQLNVNNNRPIPPPTHSISSDQLKNRGSPSINQEQNNNSNNNNSILQSFLQSQSVSGLNNISSSSSSAAPLPKLPPVKIKTLEEIENELLNQSNQAKSPVPITPQNNNNNNYSRNSPQTAELLQQNQIRMQQQQLDMSKLFPLAINNNNSNLDSNNLVEKQKKLLEAIALHQYQQQIIKFQQQQHQQNFPPLQSNPTQQQQQLHIEQQIQQQQMLLQQQLMSSQLNLNSLLPPNYPTLNPQQKQLILNQIQRNLQTTLLQQQLLQQQHQNGQMQRLGEDHKTPIQLNNNNNNNNNRQSQQQQQSQQNNRNDKKKQQLRNNNNNNNNNINPDKLAGMMTDKEKNWVVNVQMLQLQIDDPYRYDYYYTAWMLKKKQFSMRNTNSAGLKTSVLYQLMNNKQDPKNYRPLTFENSLGKVTMSNFHHPRALIDLNQRDSDPHSNPLHHIDVLGGDDDDEERQKDAKNKDTILLEIEKIYQVLLSIDEIEHSILKAPEEMRILLFQERRSKVDKLAFMLCTENFPHYLFVEKGRRLLAKCIPTFNLAQTKLILGFFMQYIYIISKNNIALDEIYSHLSYAIDTQKFTDLVEIVNQFVHLYSRHPTAVYQTIFSNKFSLTLLLKFMSKSELINQDDYDNDIMTIWSCYLNLVLAGLTLIQPIQVKSDGTNIWNISEINQLNLKAILDNFSVNTDLWSKNEMKLKELFTLI